MKFSLPGGGGEISLQRGGNTWKKCSLLTFFFPPATVRNSSISVLSADYLPPTLIAMYFRLDVQLSIIKY